MMPETEMIVSSNDHVKNVSLTVSPKYSFEHPESCIIHMR